MSDVRRRYLDRSTCRYHRDKVAEFECADCHKPFCSECVKDIDGQHYCNVCQKRLKVRRKVARQGRAGKLLDKIERVREAFLPGPTDEGTIIDRFYFGLRTLGIDARMATRFRPEGRIQLPEGEWRLCFIEIHEKGPIRWVHLTREWVEGGQSGGYYEYYVHYEVPDPRLTGDSRIGIRSDAMRGRDMRTRAHDKCWTISVRTREPPSAKQWNRYQAVATRLVATPLR